MPTIGQMLDSQSKSVLKDMRYKVPDNAGAFGRKRVVCEGCKGKVYVDPKRSALCRPCEKEVDALIQT